MAGSCLATTKSNDTVRTLFKPSLMLGSRGLLHVLRFQVKSRPSVIQRGPIPTIKSTVIMKPTLKMGSRGVPHMLSFDA